MFLLYYKVIKLFFLVFSSFGVPLFCSHFKQKHNKKQTIKSFFFFLLWFFMSDIKYIKIIAWFCLHSFLLIFGQKNLCILQRSAAKIMASGTEQLHPTWTKGTNTRDFLRWCTSKLSEDDKTISWHQSPPRVVVNVIRHKELVLLACRYQFRPPTASYLFFIIDSASFLPISYS